MQKSPAKLAKLTAILGDGEFHDGNALGESLQMTRSAVWKMIKKLERYDVQITSVKGKGYALSEPLILLDADAIRKQLRDKKCQLTVLESVGSTNDYLKALRKSKDIHFCAAEQQTAGKGRFNRAWYSPFGRNIYLSCLYPFQKDISELAGMSLVVSLAIVHALKQAGLQENVFVKWPNDIVCGGKKIAGTLIELSAESHGASHAVIGIGLNVNMLNDERGKISQAWTSMRRELETYFDRNLICAALINAMRDYLQRFEREGFGAFVKEWKSEEILTGKTVALKTVGATITGKVTGINAQGNLLMKLPDGEVRAFSSGDTSIVKK